MKKRIGNYRWRIVGLLFFATTLNYPDRQVLGILKPFIASDLGWSESDYGYIVSAFSLAYGLGLLLTGVFLDKYGTKIGYAVAVGIWSLACSLHALAGAVFGFGAARFLLGVGESANFPAAVKSVSEWFPKKRACPGNRMVQFRFECRGISGTGYRNVHHNIVWLAMGFYCNRFSWINLDGVLAGHL